MTSDRPDGEVEPRQQDRHQELVGVWHLEERVVFRIPLSDRDVELRQKQHDQHHAEDDWELNGTKAGCWVGSREDEAVIEIEGADKDEPCQE